MSLKGHKDELGLKPENNTENIYSSTIRRYDNEVDHRELKNFLDKYNILKNSGNVPYHIHMINGRPFVSKFNTHSEVLNIPPFIFGLIDGPDLWPQDTREIHFSRLMPFLKTDTVSIYQSEGIQQDREYLLLEENIFKSIKSPELKVVNFDPRLTKTPFLSDNKSVKKIEFIGMNTKYKDFQIPILSFCEFLEEMHLGDGFWIPQSNRTTAICYLVYGCPKIRLMDFGTRLEFNSIHPIESFVKGNRNLKEIWVNKFTQFPYTLDISDIYRVNIKYY